MALYNPYREYDKGMDDAYCGREPQSNNARYREGYYRSLQLQEEEDQRIEQKELLTNQQPIGGGES